jgi:ACT domain-containing protein
MKAIVSVFSKDRIGIIADVSTLLASMQVNILDLTQTIMNGFFTMVMLVDTSTTDKTFDEVRTVLEGEGKKLSLDIRIQREDIFDAMHRI